MSKSLSKARNGLRMNGSSTVAVAKKRKRELLEEESDSESSSTQNESTSGSDSEMNSKDGNSEDDDAERFRASQWVDEDDLDPYEGMTTGTSNGGQRDLQKDLLSLSFGALLKAKRTLARQEEEEEEDGSSGSEPSDSEERQGEHQVTGVDDEGRYEKREKVKRANKHAPMEMSSKRPVSRKRTVVDVSSVKFRDPRFGDAVGDFSADHFRKDYGFLSDVRQQELGTLRESLTRARKLLASSPAHLKEDRRLEVEKLERTVKRSESAIERSKREAFERDVMVQVKRDERAKRSQGKGAWHLKKGDEKKVKLQARFESLSGKEVKKVMEKKQKKMAQKEKKSRPFAAGRSSRDDGPSRKRRRADKKRD